MANKKTLTLKDLMQYLYIFDNATFALCVIDSKVSIKDGEGLVILKATDNFKIPKEIYESLKDYLVYSVTYNEIGILSINLIKP